MRNTLQFHNLSCYLKEIPRVIVALTDSHRDIPVLKLGFQLRQSARASRALRVKKFTHGILKHMYTKRNTAVSIIQMSWLNVGSSCLHLKTQPTLSIASRFSAAIKDLQENVQNANEFGCDIIKSDMTDNS